MIHLLIFLLIGIVLFMFPAIRCALGHPILLIKYLILDLYKYIRYKRWRECKSGIHYGMLNIYSASNESIFGSGKTLSGVEWVVSVYERYNGQKVYNFKEKKWEIQEVRIISNAKLNIPHLHLDSTEDIINAHKGLNFSSIAIVFIDEAGSQFNSRSFKTNISSTLLNSMMTCRHEKFGMICTSPRFLQIDSLMRQIASRNIECRKVWRFQMLYSCSAWDMENCTNVKLVKHWTTCWFIKDKHFNMYDTYENVKELKRKQASGELLTDSEVLELQGGNTTDVYRLSNRTRKLKKIYKK